jgi:hypothetical protein
MRLPAAALVLVSFLAMLSLAMLRLATTTLAAPGPGASAGSLMAAVRSTPRRYFHCLRFDTPTGNKDDHRKAGDASLSNSPTDKFSSALLTSV